MIHIINYLLRLLIFVILALPASILIFIIALLLWDLEYLEIGFSLWDRVMNFNE